MTGKTAQSYYILTTATFQAYRRLTVKCVRSPISLVPRPSYHGVPVRGPGNSGLRMRLIKTARYA